MHMRTGNSNTLKKRIACLTILTFMLYQCLPYTPVLAAPSGGTVTSGTAVINQSGTITTINQSTNKASINWQTFGIKSNETVNFNQPNASSITLNRVIGNERSVLEGALNATGKVLPHRGQSKTV